jgi:hypothetical protein
MMCRKWGKKAVIRKIHKFDHFTNFKVGSSGEASFRAAKKLDWD